MKYVFFIFMFFCISCCNHTIGIPTDPEAQPWKVFSLISFCLILILPFISMYFLIIGMWKKPSYQLILQKYLNFSIVIITVLWTFGEMSLTQ